MPLIQSIASVDTLTTIILLLLLSVMILAISLGILWHHYITLRNLLSLHIETTKREIAALEDMLS